MSQQQVDITSNQRADAENYKNTYRPNVDIADTAEEIVIEADMPGSSAELITVNFEKGLLTIHAEVPPRRAADQAYLVREYGVASFYRSFKIREQINPEGITATYQNGVLKVRLAKAEQEKPRRIQVTTVTH